MDSITSIEQTFRDLKTERDTWRGVAVKYKEAFEAQTTRFQELRDICFATQADLDSERNQYRRLLEASRRGGHQPSSSVGDVEGIQHEETFGTAVVFSPRKIGTHQDPKPTHKPSSPLFERVEQSVTQRNYGTALAEVDRLLCGSMSPRARAEGLLLKSTVLQASGPDELYDALAACSEALELCHRLSVLASFIPRLQYQRGLLYYELRMLPKAREAFGAVGKDELLYAKAIEYRSLCDDEIDCLSVAKRRSGFDENRSFAEAYLAPLEEKVNVSRY